MVRLDRITTRHGDKGMTGLADGTRVGKDHALICAIGAVDEANCVLGMLRIESMPGDIAAALPGIQNDLFDVGADLASPAGGAFEAKVPRVAPAQVERLDGLIQSGNADLAPLTSFVLPAGSRGAVMLHVARSVVRRAERDLVEAIRFMPERQFNPDLVRYLNRLSDLLFVWSRVCNDHGRGDMLWVPGAGRT